MAFVKALAIDEKIGYPEYLAGTNTSELERMYREVGERERICFDDENVDIVVLVYVWLVVFGECIEIIRN